MRREAARLRFWSPVGGGSSWVSALRGCENGGEDKTIYTSRSRKNLPNKSTNTGYLLETE